MSTALTGGRKTATYLHLVRELLYNIDWPSGRLITYWNFVHVYAFCARVTYILWFSRLQVRGTLGVVLNGIQVRGNLGAGLTAIPTQVQVPETNTHQYTLFICEGPGWNQQHIYWILHHRSHACWFFTKFLQGYLFVKFLEVIMGWEHVDNLQMVPPSTKEPVVNVVEVQSSKG